MRKLKYLGVLAVFVTLAAGAGVVVAALGDTEDASGTINVSSESADLYICEPGNVDGPDCGPDDSDGAEIVFEGLEDLRPGDIVEYDVRLKNVGTVPFVVLDAEFEATETNDPDNDCPQGVLSAYSDGYPYVGVTILGKDGDWLNDNVYDVDAIRFPVFDSYQDLSIAIAPGDFEDVRLALRLNLQNSVNCDSNEWDVSWTFTVN